MGGSSENISNPGQFLKIKKRYQITAAKYDSGPIPYILKKFDEAAQTSSTDPFRSLILTSLTLSPNQASALYSTWEKEKLDLETFRLWSCKLLPNALTILVDFLVSYRTVSLVEFMRLEFSRAEIKELPRFCSLVKNITQLSLDHTLLGDMGYHVFDGLKANMGLKLEKFSARFCGIKPSACYSISAYLRSSGSLLTFELAGNKIGILGLSMILPCLEHNKTLKTLGLGFNEIEDEIVNGKDVFQSLCSAVGSHPSIQLLNLSGNYFSERGYQAVIAGLETRKQFIANGISPGLQIKVPERISSEVYEQVHSLNLALSGGGGKKKK